MNPTRKCQVCNREDGKPYECPYKHRGICTCKGNPFSLCDIHLEEFEAYYKNQTLNGTFTLGRDGVCTFIMKAISDDMQDEKVILT